MLKKFLLVLSLVLSGNQFCHAAAFCPGPSDTVMTRIASWQDVEPFAERVVAYITNIPYMASNGGNPVSSNYLFGYGFIEKPVLYWIDGPCHNMQRLLRPGIYQAQCLLTDPQIRSGLLLIRLASKEEIEQIRQAIICDQAVFEFVSNKDKALAMLQGNGGMELYRNVCGLEGMLGSIHLS